MEILTELGPQFIAGMLVGALCVTFGFFIGTFRD